MDTDTAKSASSVKPKFGLNLSAVNLDQIPPNERELKAEKLNYFNGICSQITGTIFLGSDTVARDLKLLQSHGITHVLNAAGVACDASKSMFG